MIHVFSVLCILLKTYTKGNLENHLVSIYFATDRILILRPITLFSLNKGKAHHVFKL